MRRSFAQLPWLKQKLTRRPILANKSILAAEDALSPKPSLANDTLERLALIRRNLVSKEHRAGLNLHTVSPSSLLQMPLTAYDKFRLIVKNDNVSIKPYT